MLLIRKLRKFSQLALTETAEGEPFSPMIMLTMMVSHLFQHT